METFQQPLNHGRSCLPRCNVALAGRVEPWASVMSRCRKQPGHVLPGALGPLIICRVLARRVSGGLPEEWGHLKTERDFAADEFPCLLSAEGQATGIKTCTGNGIVGAAHLANTGFPSRKAGPGGTFSTAFPFYSP